MTTREAVSLVLQAFTMGEHGDTLVLEMGEPVKILDLARTLIQLSGSKSDEVEIAFTGLRPGEKLIEELFYSEEAICETSCPKIKKASYTPREWSELETQLDELRGTLYIDGAGPIRAKIKQIIPEYSYCLETHATADNGIEPRRAAMSA